MEGVIRMDIKTMLFKDVPLPLWSYLKALEVGTQPTIQAAIPVYYRKGDEVFFISDYVLRDNKTFEKTAPPELYRGGALLKLLTKNGQVVLYDERYKWLRLVGGIAKFDEGANLIKTAIREAVVEELAVLANGERVRFVPEGTKDLVGFSVPGWGIAVEGILETGSLSVVRHFFNDANRAFEIVVEWNLTACNDLIVLHSEDWFRGGRSGFVPFVIDEAGSVVGMYDGRHGYVSMPIQNLHPTLQVCL